MKNLVGHKEATYHVGQELSTLGVNLVPRKPRGEVASQVHGELNGFVFERLWYYYAVTGFVPYRIACELYSHPDGQKDVRVDGHCGAPHPGGNNGAWLVRVDPVTGKKMIKTSEKKSFETYWEKGYLRKEDFDKIYIFMDDNTFEHAFVECYHIDTEAGLRLFVETIRKYNLHADGSYAKPETATA